MKKIKDLTRKVVTPIMVGAALFGLSGCGSQDLRDAFWNDPLHEVILGVVPRDAQPGGFRDAQERKKLKEAYERGRRDAIGDQNNQTNSNGYIPITYGNGKTGWKKYDDKGCTLYDEKGREIKFVPNAQ